MIDDLKNKLKFAEENPNIFDKIPVLDKGFVRLVDWLGGDDATVRAARVSYGSGTKTSRDDAALIDYMIRHEHMSPFEMSEVVIHIKLPIFVLAHFVRHRTASMNSLSARYSVMQDDFYIPDEMRGQSSTNKQGSSGVIDGEKARFLKNMARRIPETAYEDYDIMLKFGLSRELSRIFLPQNLYTEIYWKQDLRNVLHLLRLRMDEHAQWETRQYANAIYEIIKCLFPVVVKSWENHTLNSVKISDDEKEILKSVIDNGHDINSFLDKFSSGRAREVVNKINKILDRE